MYRESHSTVTDDDKCVLARYESDEFGAIHTKPSTSDNVRKFTGKEWNTYAGLYYHVARYYDPYAARFTQRDPIGDGVNWYSYTYNNPLKFVDPSGELAIISYSLSQSEPSVVYDPDVEQFVVIDGEERTPFSKERVVSLMLDFTPVIGDAKGFIEGVIGKDLLTGDPLSPVDRLLGLAMISEVRGTKEGDRAFTSRR